MNYLLLNIGQNFFDREFLGERVESYCWFVGIVLIAIFLKKPLAMLLARTGNLLTEHFSNTDNRSAIHSTLQFPLERLIQTILYYIAVNQLSALLNRFVLHHPQRANRVDIRLGDVIDHVFLFLFIIFLTQTISGVADFTYKLKLHKAQTEQNRSQQQLLPLLKDMFKLLLWTVSCFWIMGSVFHVNIPALITGLGIGGVAIALAGKTTVENLFAAFTILTDKPFQTGETIRLGDIEGEVEMIGLRSTRLRGTDGAAHIIPNLNIVGGNLINLSRREVQGVKTTVNIKYGLPHDALTQIIDEIKKMLKNTSPIIEPIEVRVESYGENTFHLLVSYYLPDQLPEKMTLPDIKQLVNSNIYEVISKYTAAKEQ